jgi:integrase
MSATARKTIQNQIDNATPNVNGKTTKLYRIGDADFLLQVTPAGVKSWIYRYTLNGRTRAMGLGPLRNTTFDDAKKLARKVRVLLDDGIDPLEERDRLKATKKAKNLEDAQRMTFRQCAAAYIEAHRAGYRNPKSAAQWTTSLETYAYPLMGDKPVNEIDVQTIKKVIEPLWKTKNETGSRLRGRIEKVLGWATVNGYRQGENPARWTSHLSEIFPKRSAVRKVKHHPALPYAELPDFMRLLESTNGIGAWVMRFLILTATRTTEARAAEWSEIDMEKKLWKIPAIRMKGNRDHRIPLNEQAMCVIRFMKDLNDAQIVPSRYVFPGQKRGSCPSQAIMLALLKRIGRQDIVPHGCRSVFRDYMAEQTDFPREVAEAALAHVLADKTEAAYQRGDLLEKRRVMMDAWGTYCTGIPVENKIDNLRIDRSLLSAQSVV